MNAPVVLGLDLSLTSTGYSDGKTTRTIRPTNKGMDRLRFLCDAIALAAEGIQPDLIVIEGPSFGSQGNALHQLGGLWWMVNERLDRHYRLAVAPPPSLKKYATGKGNAGKDAVLLAAARRFDWFDGGNDEADSLFLAALGYQHLGQPLVEMPALNLTALSGVAWPVVP